MQTIALDVHERNARIEAVGFDYDAQPKQYVDFCPLCGELSSKASDVCSQDRFGFNVSSVLCNRCGFMYLNPRMMPGAYGAFYEHWYRPLVCAHCGEHDLRSNAAMYAEMLGRFIEPLAKKPYRKTALDVGGSVGAFANVLNAQWGYDCTVVDPSSDELAIAAEHGHKTIQALAEDFHSTEKFDLVAMVQTVDHLLEPRLVLSKLRSWVSDCGIVVIDFCDYRTVLKACGIKQTIKIDHPLYFSSYTAQTLLARCGLEPIHCGRTEDKRHLLFVCRPVPELGESLPIPESVEQARRELLGREALT